jgi:TP901 family phage tail tape measure protein
MAAGKSFPISLIVRAVDEATAPIRKMSASLGDLSKQVSAVGRTMTAGVTLPLAGMAAASVAAFGRFEAGMASVSTLVDTSVESVDAMGRSVLDISRRVPVGLADLTDALASARGAGVSAAEQFKVLENSAKLGAAALGSTKDAVDVVTSAINAFGLQGKEADGVYNVLFQAVNAGKMSLAQFAQGFGGVAGTVAAAGVKLDEYASSVAALTTTGLPAAEAHTQLRAVISGLTRESPMAAAAFKKLGAKSFKDLIAQSGGLVPALEKVRATLKGNEKAMLDALGSTEALNAVLGLTGNQAGTFRTALASTRSGVDGMAAAFEKQNRTAAATAQRLRNTFEGIAISVGRVLVPVLEQLAPVLERAAFKWEEMGSEGQKSVVVLAAAAAALGPTILVVSGLTTALSAAAGAFVFVGGWAKYLWMMRASIMAGFVPSLSAAAASMWGFTAALLANPLTWVVSGVAALAGVAYLVYRNWEPIKAFFLDTWETVRGAFATAFGWIGENLAWTPLGMLINNWEPIRAFFSELWDGIVETFRGAWEAIRPIVGWVSSGLGGGELAVTAGVAGSGQSLGAATDRALLGAASAAPAPGAPQSTEARVRVDFANLPPGARVRQEPGGTAPLDLNLGYGMLTP